MGLFERLGEALGLRQQDETQAQERPESPKRQPQVPQRQPQWVKLMQGGSSLDVVGEASYQEALWQIVGSGEVRASVHRRVQALLEPEPDNPYDSNAVSVWVEGRKVGYLARDDAAIMGPQLSEWMAAEPGCHFALAGEIVGRGGDARGMLGVFLQYDPTSFGIVPFELGLRTGLSEASRRDGLDDDYDLSWFGRLSDDRLKRLKELRVLALSETAPVSRHFVLMELESVLYKLRDDLPGALDEYDEIAETHHRELVSGTRAALFAKLGTLPLIETYRQSTIRHARLDPERALMWAQRGIALYGEDAHRQEWVDDLAKRVEKLSAKLASSASANRPRNRTPSSDSDRDAVVRPVDATPVMETLTCERCGGQFDRVRTRGRKPRFCPGCTGADA